MRTQKVLRPLTRDALSDSSTPDHTYENVLPFIPTMDLRKYWRVTRKLGSVSALLIIPSDTGRDRSVRQVGLPSVQRRRIPREMGQAMRNP